MNFGVMCESSCEQRGGRDQSVGIEKVVAPQLHKRAPFVEECSVCEPTDVHYGLRRGCTDGLHTHARAGAIPAAANNKQV